MNPETLAFLALAAGTFVAGGCAILAREIVHTIIYIGAFFAGLGAIYFDLNSPFLGLLQLAVYAGAVTILLMFAVMVVRKRIFTRESATGLELAPLLLALLVGIVLIDVALAQPSGGASPGYSVNQLSTNLFLDNGEWLLLLGLVMLSALVGAVHLAREYREARVRPGGGP